MTTVHPIFGTALLRMSRISFLCDMTIVSGPVIPLGIIAEIKVGPVYGLGLIARTSITEVEAERIGQFARKSVQKPFAMLTRDFDRIFDADDSSYEFEMLSTKSPTSLHFATPSVNGIEIPRHIAMHADPDGAFGVWTDQKLRSLLVDEYWAFIDDNFENVRYENDARNELKLAA
jgi:hypothetical protein